MSSLKFLKGIEDRDKRADYVHLLQRIATLELKEDVDVWRASWPFPPSHHTRPWIPAKTGYLNKLENERVIYRDKVSNSTSIYWLAVEPEVLLKDLEDYSYLIDEEDPLRDLEM